MMKAAPLSGFGQCPVYGRLLFGRFIFEFMFAGRFAFIFEFDIFAFDIGVLVGIGVAVGVARFMFALFAARFVLAVSPHAKLRVPSEIRAAVASLFFIFMIFSCLRQRSMRDIFLWSNAAKEYSRGRMGAYPW